MTDPDFSTPFAWADYVERLIGPFRPARKDADFVEGDHPRNEEGEFTEVGGAHPMHTLEGAQAHIDRLSEQYPFASHGSRIEVRPDDIGDDISVGQHRGGHVYLTPRYWNEEFLTKHAETMNGAVHDPSPEGIVTHEFGHALAHKLEQMVDPYTMWDIAYRHLGHDPSQPFSISNDQTSPYGQENLSEFLAESFTAFHNGKLSVDPYGGESHPFHAKQKAVAEGVWNEMLATAGGKRLPATTDAARYIATMYNMEDAYSTERLQAAADLLKETSKRGDAKLRARLKKELAARAKSGRSDAQFVEEDHPRDPGGKFTAGAGEKGPSAEEHLTSAARAHRKALATELRAMEGPDVRHFTARRAAVHTAAHLTTAHEAHEQVTGGEAPSMPKLPPIAKTKEAKERYAEIKDLAMRVEGLSESARMAHISMPELQSALNDLWDTRMPESGKLSVADQKLNDTLRGEVQRRFEKDKDEREQRADAYAYMDDDEFYKTTGLNFGGDSRMKPGMKAQLGRLPPSHIQRLVRNGMTVQAVQEIGQLSMSHPYAPGMRPAGLFTPREGKIEVADHVTLPDGSKRMLYSRAQTLRHEVGHAIDEITGLSHDVDFLQAVGAGIAKMTENEKMVAGYYLGHTAQTQADQLNSRRLETFAEIYAYAYSEGVDPSEEGGTFGGMSQQRRFELFGRARQIMRRKLAESMGDRRLDHQRRAA